MTINTSAILTPILLRCDCVTQTSQPTSYGSPRTAIVSTTPNPGIVPVTGPDIYAIITKTRTKDTIGKVVQVDVRTSSYGDDNRVTQYNSVVYLEVQGRKNLVKIKLPYLKIILDHDGSTRYCITPATKKEKPAIPAPVNRFKQELQVGDWVIGVGKHKYLRVGQITRWTAHNIWGQFEGVEFQFEDSHEIIKVDEEELLKTLTFAKLSGWNGK